ncbi:MAG: hypothetical protein IJV94_02730 [Bacilli bacterium]|nr:hypothetical protein [Bacilli bacterium]
MKKSKMLLALLVLSAAATVASCTKPSTSSSAPAPSTSSSAPAPSTSSAPAPSTSTVSIPNEITTVMSVTEAIAHMQGTNWKEGQILHVTGVVASVKYQEDYGSYNIVLEGGFEVYSGKLAEGVEAPVVGATITASGMSKIYKDTYEIAYNSTDKVSPNIYKVENPAPQVPTFEVPAYLEYEDISNWEDGSISANKVFGGEYMTVVPRSDKAWTVEANSKTADDGRVFTKRLKPNGKTTAKGGYIQIETAGAAKLVFYAISGSSSETRVVTVAKDWNSVAEAVPEENKLLAIDVPGDKLGKYTVDLPESGTYVLHLSNSINFYGFELLDPEAKAQTVEIASLKVVGPDEYRVGGEFDASKYTVYGVSEDGKYTHLLDANEYKLGTIDTTVEKTGENALELTASYVGFEAIKGACEIEVWNWYNITVADDLKALFVVAENATEFKNGSDIKFTANNPGQILKTVTLTVGGTAKEVTIEDGAFTVEDANGDINLTAATWEAEVIEGGDTKIEWVAETELAANWSNLKDVKIPDGTKFGDFTYNVIKDSSQSKYSNKSVPSIQLGGDGKATLSFSVKGASTITVVASATGSSKNTKVALFAADGTKVAEGETITNEDKVTTVLNIPEAGNYYIAAGASDHLRVFEITCEEKEETDTPVITPAEVLFEGTIANKVISEGLTYITNNESYPDPAFYSNGGLKMTYINQGVSTSTFAAKDSVTVTINVLALNAKNVTDVTTDAFTVSGLNAAGEVVATATLDTLVVGDNTVSLEGTAIVSVKVIMTAYPHNGTAQCNVSLGGVKVEG